MAKRKKKKVLTPRWIAKGAWEKPGAGPHTDQKKKQESEACQKWDSSEYDP